MSQPLSERRLLEIYGDTIDAVYGFASRRCGGRRDIAEDVTQEVWLRAVREWRRSGIPDRPVAWLITVARNLMLNRLRRRDFLAFDDNQHDVAADLPDAAEGAEADERRAAVREALKKLPADEARLIEAFHFERCKIAHLANAYGVSERAIEGRLRRARERLRREVELSLHAEGGVS